jgi:acetyl esterase/lipase
MKLILPGKLLHTALLLILIGCIQTAFAQLHHSSLWEKKFAHDYTFIGDIPYKRIGADSVLLDIYVPKDHSKLHPTLLFYHGGGWVK